MNRRKAAYIALYLLGASVTVYAIASFFVCVPAWLLYGVTAESCPDGAMIVTPKVSVSGLRRGSFGWVRVGADAAYTTGPADSVWTSPITRLSATADITTKGGKPISLQWKDEWERSGDELGRELKLPKDLKDGEYKISATVETPLGEASIEMPFEVLAPARVHVITDRPLYEPGNTVRFRSLVVRAKDLAPIDERPGKWIVTRPDGETLLEESAPAGRYGVAAGSFPLDEEAQTGSWTVKWVSKDAVGEASFQVEPFTLPRFSVEANSVRPYYVPGETPTLRGSVRYSSGAPVAGASLELSWSVAGDWPPPTEWMDGGLATRAETDASGSFEIELLRVPSDLRGQATLNAWIAATDTSGDRVFGSARVLLSKDRIGVEAVTELEDGLVDGFNNRMYLRATTAAGSVLSGTKLVVKRAWDPNDEGIVTSTDEDGVALLQIDPGPPVNVVIPARPVRPPPAPKPFVRQGSHDLTKNGEASLKDQMELDRWVAALDPCARFLDSGSTQVVVGVRISATGWVAEVVSDGSPVAVCVADALKKRTFPAGPERMLSVPVLVNAQRTARLEVTLGGTPHTPDEVAQRARNAALDARECLSNIDARLRLPRILRFRTKKGDKNLDVGWIKDGASSSDALMDPATAACVERKLVLGRLDDEAGVDSIGTVRLLALPGASHGETKGQPTTLLGYELEVTALAGTSTSATEHIGTTKIVVRPGNIPPLRIRATPTVASAGQKVQVKLIRGPGFSAELPEKLYLRSTERTLEAELDEKTRTATFELPASNAAGWYRVEWSTAKALVFVAEAQELDLEVSSDRPRYAPGDQVTLSVYTTVDKKGVPAAVGLIGVDETLQQLATLPGPGALEAIRPKVETSAPAFGVLDGQALSMGRIRGKNAQAATLLKVSKTPEATALDVDVYADKEVAFDPLESLTDNFYRALSELHRVVRAWERSAKKGEMMSPKKMAGMWNEALSALEKSGAPAKDGFGRTLRLHRLPSDLLALTAPRAVVADGTRLPEDVEDWARYVEEERP